MRPCNILPLLGTAAVVIVCGCATHTLQVYTGQKLPASEVVVLECGSHTGSYGFLKYGFYATHILFVDGQGKKAGEHRVHYLKSVEMLPGTHKVTVLIEEVGGHGRSSPVSITFDGQSGRTYVIKGFVANPPDHWLWIEDKDTGQVVAGTKTPYGK